MQWQRFLKCFCVIFHAILGKHSIQGVHQVNPNQNGHPFADATFKRTFFSINNIPALVQTMAWRRPGDKPLSEPVMVTSLTHVYVTRPQWVNNNINYKGPGFVKSLQLDRSMKIIDIGIVFGFPTRAISEDH